MTRPLALLLPGVHDNLPLLMRSLKALDKSIQQLPLNDPGAIRIDAPRSPLHNPPPKLVLGHFQVQQHHSPTQPLNRRLELISIPFRIKRSVKNDVALTFLEYGFEIFPEDGVRFVLVGFQKAWGVVLAVDAVLLCDDSVH